MSQPAKQAGEGPGTSFASFTGGFAVQLTTRACSHVNTSVPAEYSFLSQSLGRFVATRDHTRHEIGLLVGSAIS